MPTYQYSCADCGHFFDQVQSFSEDSLTVCPQCQGRLRKVFNAVGVVFKGSGFYRTDSRAEARKGEGGSPDGTRDGTGAGTEAGSRDGAKKAAKDGAKGATKAPGPTEKGTGSASSGSPATSSAGKTPAGSSAA